jgi:ribonuclease P protein component
MKNKTCSRDKARGAESRRKGFEKDISTQQRFQEEDTRVQAPHEDQGRPNHTEEKAHPGKKSADGLTGERNDLRFPREARIRNRAEYLKVQNTGRRARGRYILLLSIDNGLPITRFGITVSRKTGNAVTRNLVKRRLREILRQNRDRFVPGKDLVTIATRQAPTASYRELEREFLKLSTGAGLAKDLEQE